MLVSARTLLVASVAVALGVGASERPLTLEELEALSSADIGDDRAGTDGRVRMIEQQAVAIGAQHGFAGAINVFHQALQRRDEHLDGIYDFGRLMLLSGEGGDARAYYLPPAIVRVEHSVTGDGGKHIRIDNGVYRIVDQARLVTAPPQWRDYLLVPREALLPLPHRAALPRGDHERRVWRRAVKRGWRAGVRQASEELSSRIARLDEAYNGRVLYMRLSVQGRMEPPELASAQAPGVVDERGETFTENMISHTLSREPRFRGRGEADADSASAPSRVEIIDGTGEEML